MSVMRPLVFTNWNLLKLDSYPSTEPEIGTPSFLMIVFQRDDSQMLEKLVRNWLVKLVRSWENIYISNEQNKEFMIKVFLK